MQTRLAQATRPAPKSARDCNFKLTDPLGDVLPDLPPALKARLFAAFGLEILWNKPGQQATVFAEITENTLQAIPGLTDPGQDGYHDTRNGPGTSDPAAMGDLTNTNRGDGVTL